MIGLKGNQSTLRDDVQLYFRDFLDESSCSRTFEKDHGRIEEREYFLQTEIDWLEHILTGEK